jgi:hypothetical protein
MELSPSSEDASFIATQEYSNNLRNPKVHYHVHKGLHWSLCWARSNQSITHNLISLKSITLTNNIPVFSPHGLWKLTHVWHKTFSLFGYKNWKVKTIKFIMHRTLTTASLRAGNTSSVFCSKILGTLFGRDIRIIRNIEAFLSLMMFCALETNWITRILVIQYLRSNKCTNI